MQLVLERNATTPLHRQIEQQVRDLIERGDLSIGSKLPATRGLARRLGVNRSTVCAAYDVLAAQGYVAPRVGHGTEVVSTGRKKSNHQDTRAEPPPNWEVLLSEAIDQQPVFLQRDEAPTTQASSDVDFNGLIPDENLFPVDRLRRCFDIVLRREGPRLLQYGATRGYEPFRQFIAQRMRLSGASVTAEDILIVNGAQQGLDLFCRALLDPGDAVVTESPTYGNLLPLLRTYRADHVAVPMTADGMDLEKLENVLARRRVKFIYTMPHFQNPTGITSSLAHRKQLLDLVRRYDVAVLEDGFEEDLRWDGGEVLALRALDHSGRVSYVGTFSKGLCPGFRIGWLIANQDLMRPLVHLKRTTDYHSSDVLQAALTEFCKRGDYETHLRRLRRTYRNRMQVMREVLDAHMPQGVQWRVPDGGYCIWLELPEAVSDDELVSRVAREGIHVTSGRHFFAQDPGYGCLRLSISRTDETQIRRGIEILGKEIQALVREAERCQNRAAARPYI